MVGEQAPELLSPFEIAILGLVYPVLTGIMSIVYGRLTSFPQEQRKKRDLILTSTLPPLYLTAFLGFATTTCGVMAAVTGNMNCYKIGLVAVFSSSVTAIVALMLLMVGFTYFFARMNASGMMSGPTHHAELAKAAKEVLQYAEKLRKQTFSGTFINASLSGACLSINTFVRKDTWLKIGFKTLNEEETQATGEVVRCKPTANQDEISRYTIGARFRGPLDPCVMAEITKAQPVPCDDIANKERRDNPRHIFHKPIHVEASNS